MAYAEYKAMYTVEKGIPIPPQEGGRKRGLAQKLRELEIGDSLLIPRQDTTKNRLTATAHQARKSDGCWHMRFTHRTVEGGFRIWRTT